MAKSRKNDVQKIISDDNSKSMRVRGKDLQNCIFPLNIGKRRNNITVSQSTTKITEPKPSSYIIHFTIFGKHDKLTDLHGDEQDNGYPLTKNEELICASIKYVGKNSPRYFVKVNASGMLYDPIGMYSEDGLNKDLKHTGKKEWQNKEVNSKVFNFYLNYLKTKNKAWLTNSNREIYS